MRLRGAWLSVLLLAATAHAAAFYTHGEFLIAPASACCGCQVLLRAVQPLTLSAAS